MADEVIWQEHTYEILKQPDVGFGIAISGGRDNPAVPSGDPAIIISDVVKHGPAFNKLQINDTVVSVNSKLMYGSTHQQAVRELKNAGRRVVIAVKRKALVRVRDTPSPGSLRRSRSRELDNLHYGRHRSRSRDLSPRRNRSRSRDYDSPPRSRRHRSLGRVSSRSRSRSPPRRRGRSYSRSHSRSSRHRSRTPSSRSSSRSHTPPRSHRSRSRSRHRSRSRSPSVDRHSRHSRRSRSRGRSATPSSHSSESPIRTPVKHRSVGDLRSMSPLSPDPHGSKPSDDMMIFPVKPTEPKPVVLKKTRWNNSYGLKLGTRIYIQDIQPGSLADKNPELKAGDTVLMINGRNVDNKSIQEAIQIIGLSKDKLTMLVKKEEGGTVSIPAARFASPGSPETSHKDKPSEKAPSRRSSVSRESVDKKSEEPSHSEPRHEPKPSKKTLGGVQVMPAELSAAASGGRKKNRSVSSHSSRSSSHRSKTPEPAPRGYNKPATTQPVYEVPPEGSDDGHILPHDARTITFTKGRNVGIRLAGGNDVGIFVASVQEGSPAAKQGLAMGDQILSVNDVNFRNVIREEAVLTLMGLPNGRDVTIVAQPRPEVYQKILEHGTGDSFYIRTHFKYERAGDHEMSFKQGSVFRISDTLYQGMVGYWLAVRIGRSNMEIERGVIPNGSRAQQLKSVQDKKNQQSKERATQGGVGRILKKNKGKGKVEKPSSSSNPTFPAYERVVLREAGFKRPVVVFGPLADIARQRLAGDYPDQYEIANNEGTVSGQKSNRKGVIRLNTIKDIIEKDKHAILDITPTAVEKLNYAQLYPIAVFLKPDTKSAVKDLRAKLAVTEDEKRKKSGKLYDRAVKMLRGYSHVFTDIIPLNTVSDDWYRKLYSTIKDQQNMPVWVSEDKLGGTPEEDAEGVMVPGDDDRLSYVSAPASDYSVTTVGSEMLHSAADYEDEEPETPLHDEPTRNISASGVLMPKSRNVPKSSSSSSDEEDAGDKFDDDDLDDALKDEHDEGPPTSKPVPPHAYSDDNMPEAPPRGKKQATLERESNKRRDDRDRSSTSSEERRPVGARATPMVAVAQQASKSSPEPSRTLGKQSIPEGRFDPQSFLKNHIKRLNKVKGDELPSEDDHDMVAGPVAAAPSHNAPPPREPSPEPPEDNAGGYPQSKHYPNYQPPHDSSKFTTSLPAPGDEKPIPPQHLNINMDPRPMPSMAESQTRQYVPPTAVPMSFSGPKPYSRPGAPTREPVYAQVNKRRPGPQSQPNAVHENTRNSRESAGRDYAGEIDSFISTDPYRSGMPQRREIQPVNTRPPVREEPPSQQHPSDRYRSSYTPTSRHMSEIDPASYRTPGRQSNSLPRTSYQPQSSYNRFAGSSNIKPAVAPKSQTYQSYSNKPSTYRNPMSNGPPPNTGADVPPKSRFVQDKYKDYMSQIRQTENKPSNYNAYNPRPFNKGGGPPSVASKFKNGPVKDQMYDSGVDTYDTAKPNQNSAPVPVSPSSVEDDDPQVVATARGVFDSNGGVLSSVETGVSIMIPKGAIQPGIKQEIYFKVCKDNTVLPPLDQEKGETLLSPLVMCGPHGLQFNHPVELRLPHCASMTPDGWSFSLKSSDTASPGEPSQWQNMNMASDSNYQVSSNSVSVLIDHF